MMNEKELTISLFKLVLKRMSVIKNSFLKEEIYSVEEWMRNKKGQKRQDLIKPYEVNGISLNTEAKQTIEAELVHFENEEKSLHDQFSTEMFIEWFDANGCHDVIGDIWQNYMKILGFAAQRPFLFHRFFERKELELPYKNKALLEEMIQQVNNVDPSEIQITIVPKKGWEGFTFEFNQIEKAIRITQIGVRPRIESFKDLKLTRKGGASPKLICQLMYWLCDKKGMIGKDKFKDKFNNDIPKLVSDFNKYMTDTFGVRDKAIKTFSQYYYQLNLNIFANHNKNFLYPVDEKIEK